MPTIAESFAWYEKMLGFKEVRRGGQPTGQQTAASPISRSNCFSCQSRPALGVAEESFDFRTHGVKRFGFEVKNLPAVLAELQAKGVKMAFDMGDNPARPSRSSATTPETRSS